MQSKGYQPVLAHPERYVYWSDRFEELQKIKQKGVALQVNIMSLAGGYSKQAQRTAERLIDEGLVDFLGSDCHQKRQIELLEKARELPHYRRALQQYSLNNALL
jgi:tyrosine-protein phosphatase YwqE